LEAAIAGTTVPQKKEPGHAIQPVQALLPAPLLHNSVGMQGQPPNPTAFLR
jgi:hypothetical protein